MIQKLQCLCLLAVLATVVTGCGTPPPTTGFLSDYSRLEVMDGGKMRFISPRFSEYDAFIIDPVEIRTSPKSGLSAQQRAEVARYFRQRFFEVLERNGYRVVRDASTGTARVRLALTEIQEATWWMNVMPTSKVTGAGTGGASMEGEVIDSVTGEQLAAVVKSGRGNQFELDTFDALDDVKDVIDQWAEEAEKRLRELRGARPGGR